MEWFLDEFVEVGCLYVSFGIYHPLCGLRNACKLAFFGIIDLLAILPYYIEIILQQDTVCYFYSVIKSQPDVTQSVLFRFSILRMFRLLRVFRPFRYNNTILLWVFHVPYGFD
jgi:Ion transport protein